jgi:hypothetical protein
VTLEDRIAELRLGFGLKIMDLDKIIDYIERTNPSPVEDKKTYLHGLKIQRADYKFFIKELDMLSLENQMTIDSPASN